MIYATGARSAIVRELGELTGCAVIRIAEHARSIIPEPVAGATRYVLAAGLLRPKRAEEQTDEERREGYRVNCERPVELCEAILARVETARICVIGSESAYAGSYDGNYADAKARLHRYVETRQAGPHQQLVAVAPHVISDAGMTTRRHDYHQIIDLGRSAPRGRWITAREVAAVIQWLLWSGEGIWTSNAVVRLSARAPHGGSGGSASTLG